LPDVWTWQILLQKNLALPNEQDWIQGQASRRNIDSSSLRLDSIVAHPYAATFATESALLGPREMSDLSPHKWTKADIDQALIHLGNFPTGYADKIEAGLSVNPAKTAGRPRRTSPGPDR